MSVKGSVPDITACPLCKRPSLTVYRDPLSVKSKWLRCSSCRFSGDTIETFQRISRSPTLVEAIQTARKGGLCDVSGEKITPGSIQSYAEMYPQFRARVSEIWNKLSRGTVENPPPELIRYAQSKHLWQGWMTDPHKHLTQFLGGAERRTVDELFMSNFGKRALPKRGFGLVLAAAHQDVPGRICGITFMGSEADLYTPLASFKVNEPEGGLAMLDALDGAEKIVYALPRLDFAMQFQRLNFTNQDTPLKMVVYNDATREAWNAVNAERIIFWSDIIDWRLFKQAKRENGWISDHPRLLSAKRDVSIYVKGTTPEAMLGKMTAAAMPWARFLACWLTDKRRNPLDLRGTLSSVNLSDSEAKQVIDECPEKDRDALKQLLEDAVPKGPASVRIRGRTIVVRSDGWYSTGPGGDSLVTDAVVHLNDEAVDKGVGEVFWHGTITYRNSKVVFSGEPIRVIEKDPMGWLRDKLARVGLGYPRFDRSISKDFTNLVKSFSTNWKLIQITDRLGLNKSGDILFPCFSIRNGEIVIEQKQMPSGEAPALEVCPPTRRDVAAPEPVTIARASWFAAAAVYVSCLLQKHICPVYVTEGLLPRSGIAAFIESAGMMSRTYSGWTEEEGKELACLVGRFNYPVHLRVSTASFRKLPYDSYSTAFISTNRLTAASLCTQHDGIILRDAALKDGEEMPPFDDVLWYLADLQKRGFQFPDGSGLAGLLRDICQFMGQHLTQFDPAHAAIATGQMRVCQKAGDSLIELLVLLCLSGKLGVEYVNLQPCLEKACPPGLGRKAVCVDTENGVVYLPRAAIGRACDRADVPRPNLYNAEKDLSDRKLLVPNPLSDGILISTGLWNEAVKGGRSELNVAL